MHNSVSILECTLLMKLYSKNTSGPCTNLNVSYLTECKFVATFCVSDRSTPCWFVERTWVSVNTWIIKHCLRFLKKIDVYSSIGPNKSLKTGKFSSAQAGVKWRFVIDEPDIFGLFFFTIKVLFSRVPITICSSHNQFCVKLTRVCIMFSCRFVALLRQ